ncbi:MAG TPA: metallophosphoesterase [Acidimicrobiia bacterium]
MALATGSLVVGVTGGVSAATDARVTRFPYLTDLVNTTSAQGAPLYDVTVNWGTDRSMGSTGTGWVRVGTPGGGGTCTFLPGSFNATKKAMAIGPSDQLPSPPAPTTGTPEYQWTAPVSLTQPGSYCYTVFVQGPSVPATDLLAGGPYPVFKTQSPAGTNQISFAVMGDWGEVDSTGSNPNLQSIMSEIAGSGAQFVVTTGDNAYNSGSQDEYGDLQQKTATVTDNTTTPPTVTQTGLSAVFGPNFWTVPAQAGIPIFPAIGNHGLFRNDATCLPGGTGTVDACHPQYMNWPQPNAVSSSNGRYQTTTYGPTIYGTTAVTLPDAWYAFNAGNARFYVLETAWPDNNWGTAPANVGGYANDYEAHWKPGDAEYEWLKADLATHPGGLKFAFFHKPLTSDTSSARESTDTYLRSDGPAGNQSLEALLANNGVDVAFSGHAHIYERNAPHTGGASLVNYVTGGGGAQPESLDGGLGACDTNDMYAIAWSPSKNAGSACGSAAPPADEAHVFHFLKVTVNGTHVTVTPTNAAGGTFDVQSYDFGPQYTQLVGGAVTTPEGNAGTHALNIPVSLTKANPSDAVTATYTLSGSAVAGVDYTGPTTGTVTIPAGQTTGFVTVQVLGNTKGQPNRVVVATLSNAAHASIAGSGVATGTIVDDDGGVTSASASSGGYVVDGFGTLHTVTTGTAHALGSVRGAPHWNFDIARGVALLPNHTGGYVLDGFGGLHPFAVGNNPIPAATRGGPYWNGWDIAKGVAINPDGKGGYVVDAWGGLHPFAIGNNPIPAKPTGASYWSGWNIVRGVAVLAGGGGYTVDGWGGLHPFTVNGHTAPKATGGPYWSGWDIVRGVTTTPDGTAGYVLDGFGGAHPFRVTAPAPAVHITAFWNGTDIARGIAL